MQNAATQKLAKEEWNEVAGILGDAAINPESAVRIALK